MLFCGQNVRNQNEKQGASFAVKRVERILSLAVNEVSASCLLAPASGTGEEQGPKPVRLLPGN